MSADGHVNGPPSVQASPPSHIEGEGLLRDVELLSLDAGNTVIFFDHARLAELSAREGFVVDAATLVHAEGLAKHAQEERGLEEFTWDEQDAPGARGWGAMIGTMLARAGLPAARLPEVIAKFWKDHLTLNFWALVPPGLGVALDELRAAGVRVAIVSNSEGMLEPFFRRLGILKHFDAIVDSGKVGIEKPDPRIFEVALERCAATAGKTLHLGDSVATDIVGARAAGIRSALIDPHGHVTGRHLDVPRVPGVVEVAGAILRLRAGGASGAT